MYIYIYVIIYAYSRIDLKIAFTKQATAAARTFCYAVGRRGWFSVRMPNASSTGCLQEPCPKPWWCHTKHQRRRGFHYSEIESAAPTKLQWTLGGLWFGLTLMGGLRG